MKRNKLSPFVRFIGVVAVIWLIWWAVMSFAVCLEPSYHRTGYEYRLSESEIALFNADTKGMDADQIVDYAMDYTRDKLSFRLKKTYEMQEGEGNCITYAAICKAVVNQAFRNSGIDGNAHHDVGTIKFFGIDLCKLMGGNGYGFFADHDFVTIVTPDGCYSVDPSVKDLTGYDLKTNRQ